MFLLLLVLSAAAPALCKKTQSSSGSRSSTSQSILSGVSNIMTVLQDLDADFSQISDTAQSILTLVTSLSEVIGAMDTRSIVIEASGQNNSQLLQTLVTSVDGLASQLADLTSILQAIGERTVLVEATSLANQQSLTVLNSTLDSLLASQQAIEQVLATALEGNGSIVMAINQLQMVIQARNDLVQERNEILLNVTILLQQTLDQLDILFDNILPEASGSGSQDEEGINSMATGHTSMDMGRIIGRSIHVNAPAEDIPAAVTEHKHLQ